MANRITHDRYAMMRDKRTPQGPRDEQTQPMQDRRDANGDSSIPDKRNNIGNSPISKSHTPSQPPPSAGAEAAAAATTTTTIT